MAKVVALKGGFTDPKAFLTSLLERDDIEWCAVVFQTKDGALFDMTTNMELRDVAYSILCMHDAFTVLNGGSL